MNLYAELDLSRTPKVPYKDPHTIFSPSEEISTAHIVPSCYASI